MSRLPVTIAKYMEKEGIPLPNTSNEVVYKMNKTEIPNQPSESIKQPKRSRNGSSRKWVDAFCKRCGMYGHELDQCDIIGKLMCAHKWMEKPEQETKKSVLKRYRQ